MSKKKSKSKILEKKERFFSNPKNKKKPKSMEIVNKTSYVRRHQMSVVARPK